MNFICTWVGGGGTRWALTWENLWGHGCNIQVWSSENPEWIEGEGGVWATCPWAWPLMGKGWPRRTGQGECGELPSKSSVQRVHSTQTYSRLMSVSRMVHWCMGYNNMSVFLLPMLPGLWWHWYSFGWSPCVEEEVAMAGGVGVGLRSKGWSLRAWWLAVPRQGIWAPDKQSGPQSGSHSSKYIEVSSPQSGRVFDRTLVGLEAGTGRTGGI